MREAWIYAHLGAYIHEFFYVRYVVVLIHKKILSHYNITMTDAISMKLRKEGDRVPEVTFVTREGDTAACGDKSGHWKSLPSAELFKGKRVVVFALPGAYTPTCSSTHLPGFDGNYHELMHHGIDEVYCISVNDAFVMHHWGLMLDVVNVKMIPDGNADFTRGMGMLVKKENLGFGNRSWRYSMLVEDGVIKKLFVEPGMRDNADDDPFEVSDVDTMIAYLKEAKKS